jgi:hypothetical protein
MVREDHAKSLPTAAALGLLLVIRLRPTAWPARYLPSPVSECKLN